MLVMLIRLVIYTSHIYNDRIVKKEENENEPGNTKNQTR